MKNIVLFIILASTVTIITPDDTTICTVTDNVVICH